MSNGFVKTLFKKGSEIWPEGHTELIETACVRNVLEVDGLS